MIQPGSTSRGTEPSRLSEVARRAVSAVGSFELARAATLRLRDANPVFAALLGGDPGLRLLELAHANVGELHRHGGPVWADAAPERGACFFFTLRDAGALTRPRTSLQD